jgi:hypothetical protein
MTPVSLDNLDDSGSDAQKARRWLKVKEQTGLAVHHGNRSTPERRVLAHLASKLFWQNYVTR